jgi:hypothetical protein
MPAKQLQRKKSERQAEVLSSVTNSSNKSSGSFLITNIQKEDLQPHEEKEQQISSPPLPTFSVFPAQQQVIEDSNGSSTSQHHHHKTTNQNNNNNIPLQIDSRDHSGSTTSNHPVTKHSTKPRTSSSTSRQHHENHSSATLEEDSLMLETSSSKHHYASSEFSSPSKGPTLLNSTRTPILLSAAASAAASPQKSFESVASNRSVAVGGSSSLNSIPSRGGSIQSATTPGLGSSSSITSHNKNQTSSSSSVQRTSNSKSQLSHSGSASIEAKQRTRHSVPSIAKLQSSTSNSTGNNNTSTLPQNIKKRFGSSPTPIGTPVLESFVSLPKSIFNLWKFLLLGVTTCLDRVLDLYLFPIRPFLGLRNLTMRHFILAFFALIGSLSLMLFPFAESPVHAFSFFYHMIQGVSALKLYVMCGMLEVFEKLAASFGSDLLEALWIDLGYGGEVAVVSTPTTTTNNNNNNQSTHDAKIVNHQSSQKSSSSSGIRTFILVLGCILVTALHSFFIVWQSVIFNVALNGDNYSLLALLASNNFSELRKQVFKKTAPEELFRLACADVIEHMQLTVYFLVMLLRHTQSVGGFGTVETADMYLILVAEVFIDTLKHVFVIRANGIKESIYERFEAVWFWDVARDVFHSKYLCDCVTALENPYKMFGIATSSSSATIASPSATLPLNPNVVLQTNSGSSSSLVLLKTSNQVSKSSLPAMTPLVLPPSSSSNNSSKKDSAIVAEVLLQPISNVTSPVAATNNNPPQSTAASPVHPANTNNNNNNIFTTTIDESLLIGFPSRRCGLVPIAYVSVLWWISFPLLFEISKPVLLWSVIAICCFKLLLRAANQGMAARWVMRAKSWGPNRPPLHTLQEDAANLAENETSSVSPSTSSSDESVPMIPITRIDLLPKFEQQLLEKLDRMQQFRTRDSSSS